MPKTCVFATMALIIAAVAMWLSFAPVATESVTAAAVEPSTGAISPFELTLRNGKTLPHQYYADPF
jgi:hypothetical protein